MSTAEKLTPVNPLLDKRLVSAFIESVKKTMTNMALTQCTADTVFIENEKRAKGDVSGLVGMTAGSVKGNFIIAFEKGAIVRILENMLGETHAEVDRDVADCVGELTNMIYGDAKTTLNQQGFHFEAAIPSVIIGRHEIVSYHKGATLVVPFKCEGGGFFIEISVQV